MAARDDSALRVQDVVEVINQPSWHMPLHQHQNFLEVVLVIKGEGYVQYGSEKYPCKMGDLWIYNQNTLHSEFSTTIPMETIAIAFSGVRVEGMEENALLPAGMKPVIESGEYFALFYALYDFICKSVKEEKKKERQLFEAAKLTLTLVQELICKKASGHTNVLPQFPVIEDIIHYIDKNYANNIRLKELEDEFHFSQYYLAHKFKEEIGYTINEYITNRRIGEAGRLLIYTDMSISEIAQKVGYTTLSHFSAVFKKNMGIAPGKMREIHNRNS